ncbi:MAG: DUF6173 family protein [Pseudomonadota bacterium]
MSQIKTSAEAAENAAMHLAHAAHLRDEDRSPEQEPLPDALQKRPVEQKSPAEWAYERLVVYIQHFEKQLDGDHEVAMGFAGSDAGKLHIQGMGFFAPDVITFYGAGPDGVKTQLIQHVSQLNVMLRAAPKLSETPTRIGFRLTTLDEAQNPPV